MMHLWGTREARAWLPRDLKTGLRMDEDAAARMILFYVSHQRELVNYRRLTQLRFLSVKYFEISRVGDSCSCSACQRMAKKKYTLEDVPELPYEKCKSEMGCRCVALPRFD